MNKSKNPHIGPSFQSWLDEEGIAEDVDDQAVKQLLALQLEAARKARGLSKSEMAARMKTSRPVLDRLLDGKNNSVTLNTVQKAARAVGKAVRLELVEPESEKAPAVRPSRRAAQSTKKSAGA